VNDVAVIPKNNIKHGPRIIADALSGVTPPCKSSVFPEFFLYVRENIRDPVK
jgi:hypothetical protein